MKKHYQRHDVQFKRQAVKLANHPEIRTQDVAAADERIRELERELAQLRKGFHAGEPHAYQNSTDEKGKPHERGD